MLLKFEFNASKQERAHRALEHNGITDHEIRQKRMRDAQEKGRLDVYSYGSMLFEGLTAQKVQHVRACVKNMAARFNQAIDYYGGIDGYRKFTLGLVPALGQETHGLIQTIPIESADDFIKFYTALSTRENPVNNPHYSFNKGIDVETQDGTRDCITCLSDVDGPLHVGDKLTETETSVILAHAVGPDYLLDGEVFRDTGEIKYVPLKPHQKTAAAYAFFCWSAHQKLNMPNPYLERIVNGINEVRAKMYAPLRLKLEAREDGGGNPEGLATRFNLKGGGASTIVGDPTFSEYIAANNKLNQILENNPTYAKWRQNREWEPQ